MEPNASPPVTVPATESGDTANQLGCFLILLGAVVVLLAPSIGHGMATTSYGQGHSMTDLAAAASNTAQIRTLGLMAFAAGLVERLVGAVRRRP